MFKFKLILDFIFVWMWGLKEFFDLLMYITSHYIVLFLCFYCCRFLIWFSVELYKIKYENTYLQLIYSYIDYITETIVNFAKQIKCEIILYSPRTVQKKNQFHQQWDRRTIYYKIMTFSFNYIFIIHCRLK